KKRMAMILVEKTGTVVATWPSIREEFGESFQITGLPDTNEAKNLALLLRSGSLAAAMDIIEERTIGPSLGAENIRKGYHAVLGLAAVHVLGILTSIVSAVFVSRGIVNLIYGGKKKVPRISIGNVDWHRKAAA